MKDKRYTIVAKVKDENLIKYSANDLLRFTKFLDTNFLNWSWFNVYENVSGHKGSGLASFTTEKRPTKRFI